MYRPVSALVRAAQRRLRTPGFVPVVTGLVAIAVAALLTLGTAASALLWRPMPFPDGERLVRLQGYAPQMQASVGFAPGLLADVAALPQVEAVGNYDPADPLHDPEGRRYTVDIEPGLLSMLGAVPPLGRLPADDDGAGVVLLSEPVWKLLAAQLYQVSPWAPLALGCALLAALRLVLLACLGPLRHAAALQPNTTLRHDWEDRWKRR